MKCIITGHTAGVGKAMYEHFQAKGWEVIGMSRANGYDISIEQDKIVREAEGCDVFINNAYCNEAQTELVKALHTKVKKMIVLGSVAADYHDTLWKGYGGHKKRLEETCKELSLIDDKSLATIFYMKLGFCENSLWPDKLDDDYKATYSDLLAAVDLWLAHPKLRAVEFIVKQTPEILNYLVNPSED